MRLWWHTHTHSPVSLVFLPTLFLLLSVSRRGAAKPIDREKGNVCMPWLQNEPQIAVKFRLFTPHCVTLRSISGGSLWAKASSFGSSALCPLLCILLTFSSYPHFSTFFSFLNLWICFFCWPQKKRKKKTTTSRQNYVLLMPPYSLFSRCTIRELDGSFPIFGQDKTTA